MALKQNMYECHVSAGYTIRMALTWLYASSMLAFSCKNADDCYVNILFINIL